MLHHITLKRECSQMKLSKIKMFLKFNKYSMIETFWSVCAFVMDFLMLRHWGYRPAPHWYLNVLFVFFAFFSFFGAFRAFVSWKTYKIRKDDYYKCTEMFQKYGVKKSILYNLQAEPCSQEVAKQLEKDFDVKNMQKIND